MGQETAFWEGVIAIAPILGLTLVLELRQTRWQAYPNGVSRVSTMLLMTLSLAGLAWAAGESIEVLNKWDPENPPSPARAQLAQYIVQIAIAVVLVPPVSQTFLIFFGKGSATMRRLNREHAKQTKWFRQHVRDLMAHERNLSHEFCELVLANPRGVYLTQGSALRVVVSDQRIQGVRSELEKVRLHIKGARLRWRELDKQNRKLLKRADKKIGIGYRTQLVKRFWPKVE